MKKLLMALSCLVLAVSCAGKKGNDGNVKRSTFANEEELLATVSEVGSVENVGDVKTLDSLSYCLGVNIGDGIKMQMAELPLVATDIQNGLFDGLLGTSPQSHEAAVAILRDYFSSPELREKMKQLQEQKKDTTAVAEPIQFFADNAEAAAVSYALGNDLGSNIKKSFPDSIQAYWIVKGFGEAYDGKPSISPEDAVAFLQNYMMVVLPRKAAEKSAAWLAEKEKEEKAKTPKKGGCKAKKEAK